MTTKAKKTTAPQANGRGPGKKPKPPKPEAAGNGQPKLIPDPETGVFFPVDPAAGGPAETVRRLTREEVAEAANYTRDEIRAVVNLYYDVQKLRIGAGNREFSIDVGRAITADPLVVTNLKEQLEVVEKQGARALVKWAEAQPLGKWCLSNIGIGPILTAGLLAHIDFHHCTCPGYRGMKWDKIPKHECPGLMTAGAIWAFAGLLPPEKIKWERGKKRPYNATLKTLCFKIGESFKKVPKERAGESLYATLYRERKGQEERLNDKRRFADQARERLRKAAEGGWRISEEQRDTWQDGKLQPKGLDLRAMRYAVKIFLSHFHQVGREIIFGDKVRPWVIVHGGHEHYIPPPNWPMDVS
jgi:hypothetical protein